VLALARWGLDHGLGVNPQDPSQPDQEQVEQRLKMLEQSPPSRAMHFLTTADEEPVLHPSDLEQAASPEDAAQVVLETLHSNMVSRAA
jgi:hypothetical protein